MNEQFSKWIGKSLFIPFKNIPGPRDVLISDVSISIKILLFCFFKIFNYSKFFIKILLIEIK